MGPAPLFRAPGTFSFRLEASLRNLLGVPLYLLDQLLQGGVDGLLAWARVAHPLVPDHARVVDDVVTRRAGIPLYGDFTASKRPPIQLFLLHNRLELLRVGTVGVDADHGEGFLFELVDER